MEISALDADFLNNVGTITHQDVQTHYQMLLCTCFIHFIFHCTVKEFIIIWRRWEIVLRTKIIVSSGINGTGGDVIRFDAILHWFGLGSLSILSHFKNPVWENNENIELFLQLAFIDYSTVQNCDHTYMRVAIRINKQMSPRVVGMTIESVVGFK